MYISSTNEINPYKIDEFEYESLKPIQDEANKLNGEINTIFKTSNDIDNDVVQVAKDGEFNFLLINIGTSIFEGTVLGRIIGFTSKFINPENLLNTLKGKENLFEVNYFDDKTQAIINKAETPLGILVNKNLNEIENISFVLLNEEDIFLLNFVKILKRNSNAKISVYDTNNLINEDNKIIHQNVNIINNSIFVNGFLKDQNLLIMSINSWQKLIDSQSSWLNNSPSLLIIKP